MEQKNKFIITNNTINDSRISLKQANYCHILFCIAFKTSLSSSCSDDVFCFVSYFYYLSFFLSFLLTSFSNYQIETRAEEDTKNKIK